MVQWQERNKDREEKLACADENTSDEEVGVIDSYEKDQYIEEICDDEVGSLKSVTQIVGC